MSRGSYVWRGFCPRGFCPEGVLFAHVTHVKSKSNVRKRYINRF